MSRMGIGAALTVTLMAGSGLSAAWDHADVPETVATRMDIGDMYVFARGDRVTFIMTVAPFLEPGEVTDAARLVSGALYQFHLDRERDGIADAVIQVAAVGSGAQQRIDVRGPLAPDSVGALTLVAEGPSVETAFGVPLETADISVWTGPSDDPFFGNLYGNQSLTSVLNNLYGSALGQGVGSPAEQSLSFASPGEDDLAEMNVLSIVVEMPRSRVAAALGIPEGGSFHAWASTSRAP